MSVGELAMFGKAYDTVGSTNKNLILQTRGDLKIRWGNKFIDLIKNGKINVNVDLLKQADNKDSINKDGIYLIQNEENQEVWLYIGGTLINLIGEISDNYVTYLIYNQFPPFVQVTQTLLQLCRDRHHTFLLNLLKVMCHYSF